MGQLQQQHQEQPLRKDLYPQTEPYDFGFLKVSGVHTIYYEQSGNPQGHVSFFLCIYDLLVTLLILMMSISMWTWSPCCSKFLELTALAMRRGRRRRI
jgi:hypothetical protein